MSCAEREISVHTPPAFLAWEDHFLVNLQEQQIIEHYSRGQDDRSWRFDLLDSSQSLHLAGLGLDIPLAGIYERTEVPV